MSETIPNYDAVFCGKQSFHLTNLIQPYGVLIVVDKAAFTIVQVSENVSSLINISFHDIINTPFRNIIDEDSFEDFCNKTANDFFKRRTVTPITILKAGESVKYFASIHEKDEALIVEIEFADKYESAGVKSSDFLEEVNLLSSLIDSASTVSEVCTISANGIKRLSGFDKVMIYSFDEEWNGTVVAQSMEEGMDNYLGLKFPASDVPKPVRDLYFKNPFRLIPDRGYQPVPLHPAINCITGSNTDLTNSKLRSVAQVHLEYLKNMDIVASMSTRIIHNGRLWGLIACHHRSAKHLSFRQTSIFELLSNIISSKISSLIHLDAERLKAERNELLLSLVNEVESLKSIPAALTNRPEELLRFLNAEGCVIALDGTIERIGVTPQDEQVKELVEWLKNKGFSSTLHLPALSKSFEHAAPYANVASGLLAIPIQAERGDFVLAFRPEAIQKVSWGGNPKEPLTFEPDSTVYHPRNSFAVWKELVTHTSIPWRPEEIEMTEIFRHSLVEFTLYRKNRELESLIKEFEFVTDFIPQILWAAKPDGRLDYWNHQWSAFTGLTRNESEKTGWLQLLHPEDREKTIKKWKEALQLQNPFETEYRFLRTDGTYRWFLARGVPLRDEKGQIIKWYGSSTDIHDQKLMAEVLEDKVAERTVKLEAANWELEQSNDQLRQFVTIASHDLQEPLRKIHVFGSMLKDSLIEEEELKIGSYLDKIIGSSVRMKRLITDLLDYSAVTDEVTFRTTDLNEVVSGILADLEIALSEKKAEVDISELPVIDAVPGQMTHLFQNLISNSLKFSRDGVPPIVSIASEKVASLDLMAPKNDCGTYFRISVADNGIGFREEHAEQIFDIFQRLPSEEALEGTGIGLAITKKIIKKHRGIIAARSKENEGSTFTFILPVYQKT